MMTASAKLHIKDDAWLRGVRSDLDSSVDDWASKTPGSDMSKLQALGAYLDTILRELGYLGRIHDCPECGIKHVGPDK